MKIKSVALTDKNQVRPAVRKAIVDYVAANPSVFANAARVDNKNVFTMQVTDANDNVVYVNFDVTVSTKAAADRAPRKPKAKSAPANDPIDID